jgi:hypothetical protein
MNWRNLTEKKTSVLLDWRLNSKWFILCDCWKSSYFLCTAITPLGVIFLCQCITCPLSSLITQMLNDQARQCSHSLQAELLCLHWYSQLLISNTEMALPLKVTYRWLGRAVLVWSFSNSFNFTFISTLVKTSLYPISEPHITQINVLIIRCIDLFILSHDHWITAQVPGLPFALQKHTFLSPEDHMSRSLVHFLEHITGWIPVVRKL